MPRRHLPVRPELDPLLLQAEELLHGVRAGDPAARTEFAAEHPDPPAPEAAGLDDARLALARSYGVADWPRLVQACRVVEAILNDDVVALRTLVEAYPRLLHEPARGAPGNWGPPMSYAANLGRDRIIRMLRDQGAQDLQWAFDRACLQGRIDTARLLYDMGARPAADAVMGPAETQSGSGMALLLELGASIQDADGDPLAPVAMVLETYCRNPEGKHRCLELFAAHGIDLPDTPPMAVHRGRIDLLAAHVVADSSVLDRTWTHDEIWPRALGCHEDESLALHGTPLAGGTLLHLCVDNDEMELATWLLDHGADPDAPAAIDADGFGGHTALFGCVVSQPYEVGLRRDDGMARLLLDRGADPNVRASLRKRLRFVDDETLHEFHDVTPLSWGDAFHDRRWVAPAAMAAIEAAGGVR
ncbi:MAG: hypothetical protein RH859_04835 [Longimicrobiales bacterium]